MGALVGSVSAALLRDWLLLALSLFNTLVPVWLGLTVLLNGDQRSAPGGRWGFWLAGAGLLAGAAFFVSHAIILGTGLDGAGPGLDFWWRLGWLLLILMPCGWYVLMLWYGSFREQWRLGAQRHHLAAVSFCAALALGMAGLLLLANPLPPLAQGAALRLAELRTPSFLALAYGYPLYNLLAIGFSLDALRRPMPAARLMGDLARGRAQPWLAATAAVLLAVSLLVTGLMAWGLASRAATLDLEAMLWFDLLISALVSAAIVLLGQALIAYEVFTGQVLPRRAFARQWRRTLILAAGSGLVLSGAIALRLPAIYLLVLSVLVSAVFFALVTWRSHLERDYTVRQMRPFVASQRLYEQVLSERPAPDEGSPFAALCQNLLGARQAYLIAVGPQSAFAGAPLAYPVGRSVPMLDGLLAQFTSPQVMIAPVDPRTYAGAEWAAPLWSERGLIGVLLLGPKTDGGLYTQEEIEIARASGERLIDARSGAEIARRLLAMQRERLAESQVLDRRTRRVLHDDVLPELQAALLNLNGIDAAAPAVQQLSQTHRQIAQLLHDLPAASADLERQGLLPALRELVGTEWSGAFDSVDWQIDPAAERAAQALSPLSADVLFHAAREAIRNAARHARSAAPARPLHLRIALSLPGLLCLSIEDDGVGMAATGGAPAGHGLALHATLLAIVGGGLDIESSPARCTRVTLRVPTFGS